MLFTSSEQDLENTRDHDCDYPFLFCRSFITIHQQSNFERMSTKVQVLMVRLLSSVAGMDLDGNLAWTETTHYKSAYGERTVTDLSEIKER